MLKQHDYNIAEMQQDDYLQFLHVQNQQKAILSTCLMLAMPVAVNKLKKCRIMQLMAYRQQATFLKLAYVQH